MCSSDLLERRLHPRPHSPPLTVTIGSDVYEALDWSLGGCRLTAEPGRFFPKQKLEGRIDLDGPKRASGDFTAEVVRATAAGDIGLRWLELSTRLAVEL